MRLYPVYPLPFLAGVEDWKIEYFVVVLRVWSAELLVRGSFKKCGDGDKGILEWKRLVGGMVDNKESVVGGGVIGLMINCLIGYNSGELIVGDA